MGRDFLPRQDIALADGSGRTTTPFYVFLQGLERAAIEGGAATAELQAQIAQIATLLGSPDGTVEGIPYTGFLPNTTQVFGLGSINVGGSLADGAIYITLLGDNPQAGSTWYYGTGPDGTRGLFRIYDALETPNDGITKTDSGYTVLGEVSTPADLPGTGNTGEAWRVVDESPGLYAWDGAAFTLDEAATGVVGIVPADDLAAVEALSAAGLAVRTGTDTWALREIDLAPGELDGLNLDGVAGDPLLGLADVTPAVGGTLLLTTFDAKGRRSEEDDATAADLPYDNATSGLAATDVQAAIDEVASVLPPPVTSVFGRVGAVVAQTGDYTPAQVGADPSGSAAAAQAAAEAYADGKVVDSIADSDTTHAPSRNAVFDALALKFDKSGGTVTGAFNNAYAGTVLAVFESTDNGAVQFRLKSDSTIRRFVALTSADVVESQLQLGNAEINFWGATTSVKLGSMSTASFSPDDNNVKSLGTSGFRWSNVYSVNVRPGAGAVIWTSGSGSPEGAVTAPVGSLYTRTDGGAGTTLYVKQSGAGNTGWVGK